MAARKMTTCAAWSVGAMLVAAGMAVGATPVSWNPNTPMATSEFYAVTSIVYDDGSGPALYAGVDPTVSGMTTSVVKWTTKNWVPVGTMTEHGLAKALVVHEGRLYAAVTSTGSATASIMSFDGLGWRTVASLAGTESSSEVSVNAMAVYDGGIVVAGRFSTVTPWREAIHNIAILRNNTWEPVGGSIGAEEAEVHSILIGPGNVLHAGGKLPLTGNGRGRPALGAHGPAVVRLTENGWERIGEAPAMNGEVRALAEYGGSIIAAGTWNTYDPETASFIARVTPGTTWSLLEGGIRGPEGSRVSNLSVINNVLVATGSFDGAGTIDMVVPNIAFFDGRSWSPVDTGLEFPDAALIRDGDKIIASGFIIGITPTPVPAWREIESSVIGCPANYDGSVGSPLLTGADIACYVSDYRAGTSRADVDGVPGLTAMDFVWFMAKYRAGCP